MPRTPYVIKGRRLSREQRRHVAISNLPPPMRFRAHDDLDMDLILSSYLKSLRHDGQHRYITNELFFTFQQQQIKGWLQDGRCGTVVACDPQMPSVVYGWALGSQVEGVPLVHYVYVKHVWRRRKIATLLLEALVGGEDPPLVLYTHSTVRGRMMPRKDSWVYHPYLLSTVFNALGTTRT